MRELMLPLSGEDIASLKAYDQVFVTGSLYVGRDQVHKRLYELLQQERSLPISLEGETMYYMGPSPAPQGKLIGSCGPTTSARMDPFSPLLLDHGLKVMIGKGPRSKEVARQSGETRQYISRPLEGVERSMLPPSKLSQQLLFPIWGQRLSCALLWRNFR